MLTAFQKRLQNHGLWRATSWILVASFAIDGSVFFAEGTEAIQGPSYTILRSLGGGRIYGAVLLALAVLVSRTAVYEGKAAQYVLYVSFCICSLMACTTVGGWYLSGQWSISTFSKWLVLAGISFVLSATARTGRTGSHPTYRGDSVA